MNVVETDITGIYIIEPDVFEDDRGFTRWALNFSFCSEFLQTELVKKSNNPRDKS